MCLRVEVIREAAVGILAPLLLDTSLLEQSNVNKTVPSALKAVAWVVGEYAAAASSIMKRFSTPCSTRR